MTQPEQTPEPKGTRESKKEQAAARKTTGAKPGPRPLKVAGKKDEEPAKAPAKTAQAPETKPEGTKPPVLRDKDHPFYVKTGYKPKKGEKLYEATGESGQIAVQSHGKVMTHALSWAAPNYPGERAHFIRLGVCRHFFASLEAAEKAKTRMEKNYPDCTFVIVPVREYQGPAA